MGAQQQRVAIVQAGDVLGRTHRVRLLEWGGVMVGSTLLLAVSALLRNEMRSGLTMLGIVIGVAAVGTVHGMEVNTFAVPLFTAGALDAVRRLPARKAARLRPLAALRYE
jgi:hypothetical protein